MKSTLKAIISEAYEDEELVGQEVEILSFEGSDMQARTKGGAVIELHLSEVKKFKGEAKLVSNEKPLKFGPSLYGPEFDKKVAANAHNFLNEYELETICSLLEKNLLTDSQKAEILAWLFHKERWITPKEFTSLEETAKLGLLW